MVKKKTKVILVFRNGVAHSLHFSAQVPMSNDIMKFLDHLHQLPQNYSIFLEGVKTRAEVFVTLEFPATPRPVKKYPTKKNVIRYLENLDLTYYLKDMMIPASRMDRVVESIGRDYSSYTKWSVAEYEVRVDHSMILRRSTKSGQYSEFVRRLFHAGKD